MSQLISDNEKISSFKSKRQQARQQYSLYKYYVIIAIISLIAVFILPMLGSNPTGALDLPYTFIGWVIYITTKICVAVINMLLFHCFMRQGLLQVQDHPKYIEACEILARYGLGPKSNDPRSPEVWEPHEYKTKGITVAITTVLSAVVITQAVLTFNWIAMLTYLFTIVFGVIFGIMQQDTAETYWTDEFWRYAKKIEKQMEEKLNDNNKQNPTPQS